MIAIGGVIGVTIFSTDGEILNTAGPAGLLAAWLFVALTTIFVMECIGELVIMWPVSNAMIEYVKAFLDEDLAIVVGIAYWCVCHTVYFVLADRLLRQGTRCPPCLQHLSLPLPIFRRIG